MFDGMMNWGPDPWPDPVMVPIGTGPVVAAAFGAGAAVVGGAVAGGAVAGGDVAGGDVAGAEAVMVDVQDGGGAKGGGRRSRQGEAGRLWMSGWASTGPLSMANGSVVVAGWICDVQGERLVTLDGSLLRNLTLDTSRTYQPSGLPRQNPKSRITSH
jgi:hypothetical protein